MLVLAHFHHWPLMNFCSVWAVESGWSSEWMCVVDVSMTMSRSQCFKPTLFWDRVTYCSPVHAEWAASWASAAGDALLHLLSHHRNTGITDICYYVWIKWIRSVQTQVLLWHGRYFTHWAIFLAWLINFYWFSNFLNYIYSFIFWFYVSVHMPQWTCGKSEDKL